MSSTDGKDLDQKSRGDAYEATVLEFLDNEISSTTQTKEKPRPRHDDLDALVDSLLKESIVASEAMEAGRDAGLEDLDRLFASIFKEHREEAPAAVQTVAQEAEVTSSAILPEVGVDETPTGTLLSAESASSQATVETCACEMAVQAPMAVPEAAPINPPISNALAESEAEPVESESIAPPPPEETVPALVFSLPPRRPSWNLRMALIGGAFLCLLAGTGIIYYSGAKNAAAGKSGAQPASAVQSPSATPAEAPSPLKTPESAAGNRNAIGHTGDSGARGTAPAVSISGNGAASPTVRIAGKPGANASAPAPSPGAAAGAPASAIEKPAAAAVPPPEPTLSNPPARATEIASPPPVTQALTNAELPSTIPAVKLMTTADDVPPVPRAVTSAPMSSPNSVPRKVMPAEAISRVIPNYPEIARRSRTTGTVVVDVQIDEKGKVVKATPVRGPVLLHAEAVNAVLRWQFKPASIDGVAVTSSSQVSIVFK